MTAIEQYTHSLLEKHGIQRGCKDKATLDRAKRIIDSTIIPISVKKAYKAAEEYIGLAK